MALCPGLCDFWWRPRSGDADCSRGPLPWYRLVGFQRIPAPVWLRRVKNRRRFCFFVRHVFPRFRFPQSLSNATTSFFRATSDGCGVGHCRPAQTRSSTRHIQRRTASRPCWSGGAAAAAANQEDSHASHGRMDGVKLHQRLSILIRSSCVRRL